MFRSFATWMVAAALLAACSGVVPTQVELYSFWTTGPEAVGLQQVSDQFHAKHPDAKVVNVALTPRGSPVSVDALRTRIRSGAPLDGFQTQFGKELVQNWVKGGDAVPLDDVYGEAGLRGAVPEALLELVSYLGLPYAVPVDVHRANVLFYNTAVLTANNIDPASLGSFEGFEMAAERLRMAGVTPLAFGDREPWTATQLFETVLLGSIGPAGYRGLWTGETDWNGAGVTRALENLQRMVRYVNADHSTLTWDQANQLVIDGRAAMTITSDWADGDYVAKGFSGYGWTPPPGNQGAFDAFGDSFVLVQGSEHPELARELLGLLASREGQQSLNSAQGALCARTDCDYSHFDAYLQSSADDWKRDAIVPSLAHGAAASEDWLTAINEIVAAFINNGDIAGTQAALAQACASAGACK